MVVEHRTAQAVTAGEGVERRVLARGGRLMAVEFVFKKDAVGKVHTHPHEQVGYIAKGRFILEIEGRQQEIGPGDTYYVAANVPHGVVALEDGVIVDVFTPMREDFLG
ncbi:MAG: cupin domain-containing protein [Firmicutes bacterium]|nr:cupin domain-containing protein [Bacillota bacterium]